MEGQVSVVVFTFGCNKIELIFFVFVRKIYF